MSKAYHVFKWLKSCNGSSKETKRLGNKTRIALGLTQKQYRKLLAWGRAQTKLLERAMSENRWEDIEFDHIPSKAGVKYRKAFERHDVERAKANPAAITYKEFAKKADTVVNAKTLYPYEVVAEALKLIRKNYSSYLWSERNMANLSFDDTQRLMVNKYWDNLKDVFNEATFDGLCVVDTSGSMVTSDASAPINVAISLGLYCAERARGPFAGHYISFASEPQLIKTEGVDFVDKVYRIYKTNLVDNTNIEATFDLVLNTAIKNKCRQEDLPKNILIISDMEFDTARRFGSYLYPAFKDHRSTKTLMENIEAKWNAAGYQMPTLTFWNVDARQNNIPMTMKDGINFVSGCSPIIFKMIMSGKTAENLMFDTLGSERYSMIG